MSFKKIKFLPLLLPFIISVVTISYSLCEILFDDFDTHWWRHEGGDQQSPTLEFVNLDSSSCLKVITHNNNYCFISTKRVKEEDWSEVSKIMIDTFLSSTHTNVLVTLKLKTASWADFYSQSVSVSPDTWQQLEYYTSSLSTYVAGVQLVLENLGGGPCTFYFDNLRLLNGGTTEYWDRFENNNPEIFNWAYYYDAVVWNSDYTPISHNASTSPINAGSLYMKWDANNSAEEVAMVFNYNYFSPTKDLSKYNILVTDVYCSTTTAPIYFIFVDSDNNWNVTSLKYVSSVNQWERLKFDLPQSGIDLSTIKQIQLCVRTRTQDNDAPYGEIFFDNIIFVSTPIISKIVDKTQILPGEIFSSTISVTNVTSTNFSKISLIEVVPIYSILNEEVTADGSPTIEYYYNNTWSTTFSTATEKFRCIWNTLPANTTYYIYTRFKVK